MRWLCFLLASSAAAQGPVSNGGPAPAKSLRFDLALIPATRDSFGIFIRRGLRGYIVWQYEIHATGQRQIVLYSQSSELQPIEEERFRVELDRLSGLPLSSYYHVDLFTPTDTIMVEHDLRVADGRVVGRRRVGTKDGKIHTSEVSSVIPPGTVWFNYQLYAAAVTNAEPGDSLSVPDYIEDRDSVGVLTVVAEQPTTVRVHAGQFDVLPLRSNQFRVYVTRAEPRRVVKGETLDGVFSFELLRSAAVVPSQP
ncbi:MAG TPA: hypothetical protein VLT79_10330 [Gemmatimonadales bacterium]|nr:hypothetical protein [Gemmatimonadales bacterium]